MSDLSTAPQSFEEATALIKAHMEAQEAPEPDAEEASHEDATLGDEEGAGDSEDHDVEPEEVQQKARGKTPLIPKPRFDEVSARASAAEQKLAEMEAFVVDLIRQAEQAKASKQEPESAAEDYDPIDEAADKRYRKELQELRQKQEDIEKKAAAAEFYQNLNAGHAEAKQRIGDFDTALEHYSAVKMAEIRDVTGLSGDALHKATVAALEGLAASAMQRGQNFGDMFYGLAKATGYKPAASTPAKPVVKLNPKEIARSQQEAGKAATEKPLGGSPKVGAERMEQFYKGGKLDYSALKTYIAQNSH